MNNDHYQEHLEWEDFYPQGEVTYLSFETGLYSLNNKCIIKFQRNSHYKLQATISGIYTDRNEIEPNGEQKTGTFIPDETITGFSKDAIYKYKFHKIFLGNSKSTPYSVVDRTVKFEAELITYKIEQCFNDAKNIKIESIQEWFLSGRTEISFTNTTKRSVDKSYKRYREGLDSERTKRVLKTHSTARDFLLVKTSDFSLIVSKVPKEIGPEWSFNLSIEYRKSLGRLPTDDEREAISELVSFVLGTQLLKVGESHFDKSNNLINRIFQNPWGDDVVSKCQKPGTPPVFIDDYNDWDRAKRLLNELLPEYLRKRTGLRLKDSLWKYWIAKYSSVGANLPILSSAVETLADCVIKEHKEIKQYYIKYDEFCALISEEIKSIELKLNSELIKSVDSSKIIDIKEKIVKKIKAATQRGANEKLVMMFDIIQLPVGKIEDKAIKARNKMAHSSLGEISNSEIIETVKLTRAYETLFHRIILKVLGYNGTYVDYYSADQPNRPIDEFIPE